MKIICIIPAWNEEATIRQVVKEARAYVDEVVVVDDGSNDKTGEIAKNERVTVLSHIINRGQGAALQTGNQYALKNQADIVVHFDADGQFTAKEIKDVADPIKSGQADIVFGSRFLTKKSNIPWLKNYIIIPLAHLVNKIFIGESLTDPQSGFRALSRRALRLITIEQDDMAHCSEIIFKAFRNNLKIKEAPISVVYKNFGQRLGNGFKIIKDLFIARLIN